MGGSVVSDNDILVKVQNKVLRIISRTKRTEEAWKSVNDIVLPIRLLYKLEIAKYCYKHSENTLPKVLSEQIMPTFISSIHSINTKHSEHRNYHITTSDFLPLTAKSFHVDCIKVWNNIPLLLKQQPNMHKFNDIIRK